MISSGAFGFVDVLNSAANSSWLRNEVLSSNIANVDTPNYKRKDVTFATCLNSALGGGTDNSVSTLTQRVKNIDLSSLKSTVYTENSALSYRSDGNNVDIETENVELASNQIMYQAMVDSMNSEFSRIKSVLT